MVDEPTGTTAATGTLGVALTNEAAIREVHVATRRHLTEAGPGG